MKRTTAPAHSPAQAIITLRAFALGLPGAREEFPWGDRVAKVGTKIFVFLGRDPDAAEQATASAAQTAKSAHRGPAGTIAISVKLPRTHLEALALPFVAPTGYGLGKSGWITARFERGSTVPVALLQGWIEESYRAIAPRKLVAELDGRR